MLSNGTDPAREAEFNRWYEAIHVADILETGAFHTAYRYESLDPQATKTTYLALYEDGAERPGQGAGGDEEGTGRLGEAGTAV